VIFVDNHSSDNSSEYVKKVFKEVVVIESEKNLGFASGNNLGIKKALELKSDYIFLLNPDTVIDEDCLSSLIKNANDRTILQPLILLFKNGKKTNIVNTAGGYLNFLGFSYCGGYKNPSSNFQSTQEIIVASGAGVFIPNKVFKEIGGFDELFFMYHEDVDLFWRARLAGYKIMLLPSAKMWHKYEFSRNKKKFFYSERNRLLFLFKNFSIKMILVVLPALIISDILMILFSIKEGWFGYKLRSYFSLISLFPHVVKERMITKHKVSYHDLKLLIDSEISFSEVKIPALKLYNLSNTYYWSTVNKLI
jgi:hypothetical protein